MIVFTAGNYSQFKLLLGGVTRPGTQPNGIEGSIAGGVNSDPPATLTADYTPNTDRPVGVLYWQSYALGGAEVLGIVLHTPVAVRVVLPDGLPTEFATDFPDAVQVAVPPSIS